MQFIWRKIYIWVHVWENAADGGVEKPPPLPFTKSHPDRINIDPVKYSCETRVVNFGFVRRRIIC